MTEVLYLTEPDDPLLPKVQAAAKGRVRLTVEPGSFDLKNAADFDALLIGDVRLGARIEKLAGPKLIQLTRGDHLDVDVLALNNSGVTVAGASPALAGFVVAFARGLGEYGSVIFIAGNMPMKSEITPLLIMIQLEQFDYAGAAAIALVFLAASFTLLLVANRLTARRARAEG